MSAAKHLALLVEIPSYYTADIEDLKAECIGDFENESDFILNVIGGRC